MPWYVQAPLALAPVLIFLLVLLRLDTFRLIRPRRLLGALVAGGAVALLSYVINNLALEVGRLPPTIFAIVLAPLIEESLKAAYVTRQIALRRVGFLVDAAVLGFATGAGFAIVENIYYLHALGEVPQIVWLVRGFGTALMHGGTTAIVAVYLRGRQDNRPLVIPWLGGVALATLAHAAFNRFMTEPLVATVVLFVSVVVVMTVVYRAGERRLRDWLGRGFDRDRELLALISGGQVRGSPLGRYLLSLRESFRADTVTDMLCLVRLQVELSLRAKGALILREQGLEPAPDPDLPGKIAEVRHLEGAIGRTGLLAMRPICHWRDADQWQRQLLDDDSRG